MDGELEAWLNLHDRWPPSGGTQAELEFLNDRMLGRKDALLAAQQSDIRDPVMRKMRAMHRARVLRLETPADRIRRESVCPTCGVSPRPDRPAPPAASHPRRQAAQPEPKRKPAGRLPKQTAQLMQHLADIGAALTRNRRS